MKKYIACMLLIIIIASATFLGYKTAWYSDWSFFVTSASEIDSSIEDSSNDSSSLSGSTSNVSSNENSSSMGSASTSASGSSSTSLNGSSTSSEENVKDIVSLNNLELKYKNNVGYYELDFNQNYSFDFAFLNDVNVGNIDVTLSCSDYELICYDVLVDFEEKSVEYIDSSMLTFAKLIEVFKLEDVSSSIISGLSLKGNTLSFNVGSFGVKSFRENEEYSTDGKTCTLYNKSIFDIDSSWEVFCESELALNAYSSQNQEVLDNYFINITIADSISGYSKTLNLRFVEDNYFESLKYNGEYVNEN